MGEVLVADSKNKRIQTFTRRKLFKDSFPTNDEPYSVAVDVHYNVVVGTTKKTIELYRRGGTLINRFSTMPGRDQVSRRHAIIIHRLIDAGLHDWQ